MIFQDARKELHSQIFIANKVPNGICNGQQFVWCFFYGLVWLANHFPLLHLIVESRKGTTGASPRGDDPNPSK